MNTIIKVASAICIATLLLVGCSSDKTNETTDAVNNTKAEESAEVNKPISTPIAEPVQEPAKEVEKEVKEEVKKEVKKAKKLSADESTALDYVTIYLNGTDIEKKKKFVQDKIYPDVQPLFQLAESSVTEENNRFNNPKVVESIPFESEDKKGHFVLISSEDSKGKNKEIIILTLDGKMAWGYTDSTKEDEKMAFDQARKQFK
ncbi:hypothetical protein J2T13_005320 [Paenibacillus sp. DS2015]|uniref:hypothetical protein n=1 Tax=Paenibacillus sp. DS2015 TaxID=3373917 RepID=UPI003D2204F3